MTAFERQLMDEIGGLMGPPRPVDDLAVFDALVAANRQQRWGVTMFSVLRFVAAAVIVALFGGFLVAGVLTTSERVGVLPAAVTEPPSPRTTKEVLEGMVTEEVEPGVYRVVNDGVRDLGWGKEGEGPYDVVAGRDGSVWLLDWPNSTVRLGDETEYGWDGAPYEFSVDVAADGTAWKVDSTGSIASLDGRTWTEHTPAMNSDDEWNQSTLKVGPDGTIWALSVNQDRECSDLGSAGCRHTVLTSIDGDRPPVIARDWSELYDGPVAADAMAVSPDGEVWLMGVRDTQTSGDVEALLRFDGLEWQVVEVPDGLRNAWAGQSIDIGADGTLWAAARELARLDDSGWTVFSEADGVPPWGTDGFIPTDHLHVATDGTVWVNAKGDGVSCGGVASFDGTTWSGYLQDLCVHDMDIAPDGAVWVRAGTFTLSGGFEYWDPPGLYVIMPEAATATEPSAAATTEEALSAMVTDEVEPGVLRVVNDGIRELGAPGGTWGQHGGVTIGSDGTVWIHEASGRYYRAGGETTRDLPQAFRHTSNTSPWETFGAEALHAGPAGELWAWDAELGRVNAWADTGWLERSNLATHAMAVDAANEAWAAGSFGLLHVDADDATIIAWPDDRGNEAMTMSLGVSADGTAYVLAGPGEVLPDGGFLDTLLRYDGDGWTTVALPTPISAFLPGDGMGVGADGTVWIAADDYGAADYMHHSLARLDGSEWTVFDAADGVRPWGGKEGFVPDEMLGVSTDGSVWVDAAAPDVRGWAACDGVARFDGATWSQYLPGRCLVDIDFAPDGSAWVLAAESAEYAEILPYVITPEAAATAEGA